MALLDNLFGTPPEYLSGLLGQDELGGLQRKANTTGLINTALAFIAQPRNQRYGSVLPYLGRALMAGQQSGQNVYENALRGFETQQKVADLKRQQEQRQKQQQYIQTLPENIRAAAEANPELAGKYAERLINPPKRDTATVGNVVIDTQTGQPIFTAPQEVKPRATREVDAGNKVLIVDAVTGETVREIPKGLAPQRAESKQLYASSPTETASGYVFMPTPEGLTRGLKPIDANTGAPVQSLVGAKQLKQQETEQKQANALAGTLKTVNNAQNAIGKAKTILTESPGLTTGIRGAIASRIPGTDRKTLEGAIKTIQANLSFQELKDMKAASPTGGALGSVTERELDLLGSTVANLDPNLPADELLANIDFVEKEYNRIKSLAERDLGVQNIIPSNAAMPTAQPVPKVGTVKNGYVFKGGNPNDQKNWIKKGR
jgi:hypothetical protein